MSETKTKTEEQKKEERRRSKLRWPFSTRSSANVAGSSAETQGQPQLTAWDKVLLARHAQRPHALDYIRTLFTDFVELHGDRRFGDDPALVGGIAKFHGHTVVVMGHQKGRDTRENVRRNWGMPRPEGYRKALRLFHLAEKFNFPILTFIDTSGADPGLHSEERGQANAIAENILAMTDLKVPIISTVIGEGGSGGALAIGVADKLIMLEHSIYSVASPEGTAAILWRDSSKAPEAARAMRITAQDLYELGIIDAIVPEPEGGAHNDLVAMLASLDQQLVQDFNEVLQYPIEELLELRYQKYRVIGAYQEGFYEQHANEQ